MKKEYIVKYIRIGMEVLMRGGYVWICYGRERYMIIIDRDECYMKDIWWRDIWLGDIIISNEYEGEVEEMNKER